LARLRRKQTINARAKRLDTYCPHMRIPEHTRWESKSKFCFLVTLFRHPELPRHAAEQAKPPLDLSHAILSLTLPPARLTVTYSLSASLAWGERRQPGCVGRRQHGVQQQQRQQVVHERAPLWRSESVGQVLVGNVRGVCVPLLPWTKTGELCTQGHPCSRGRSLCLMDPYGCHGVYKDTL
jgi:hypothetical protein